MWSCSDDDSTNTSSPFISGANATLYDLIRNNQSLNEFEVLLNEDSTLIQMLKDTSDFITVFAFNDDAIQNIDTSQYLLSDLRSIEPRERSELLKYHMSTLAALTFSDFESGFKVFTEKRDLVGQRQFLTINKDLSIRGANIAQSSVIRVPNQKARNGVLHIIDEILIPEEYLVNPDSSIIKPQIEFVSSAEGFNIGDSIQIFEEFNVLLDVKRGSYPMEMLHVFLDGQEIASGIVSDQTEFLYRSRNLGNFPEAGTHEYRFSVTDFFGNEGSIEFTVEVINPFTLFEVRNVTLQNQNGSAGNFYNVLLDSVFDLNVANSSGGALVDFFFHFRNSQDFSLYSPVDPEVSSLYGGVIPGWSVRKGTQVVKANVNYGGLTINQILAFNVNSTQANTFFSSQEIVFELEDGTKGVLEITDVVPQNSGYMRFNMKYVK
jgi:uncharacterized surface protein with fasciclin (FAS1) repeats